MNPYLQILMIAAIISLFAAFAADRLLPRLYKNTTNDNQPKAVPNWRSRVALFFRRDFKLDRKTAKHGRAAWPPGVRFPRLMEIARRIQLAIHKWRHPMKTVCLANAGGPGLGMMLEDGKISLFAGPNLTLPVTSRWLLYGYDTDQYHAKLASQTVQPLGPSPDSPSNTLTGTTDQLAVYLLGAKRGTLLGIAGAAAVTHGNFLVADAGGVVSDLTQVANGNWWVVGTAIQDAAAGAEFGYTPTFPKKVTVTTGAITAVLT